MKRRSNLDSILMKRRAIMGGLFALALLAGLTLTGCGPRRTVKNCDQERTACLQKCTAPGMPVAETKECAARCDKKARECGEGAVY